MCWICLGVRGHAHHKDLVLASRFWLLPANGAVPDVSAEPANDERLFMIWSVTQGFFFFFFAVS